MAHAGRRREVTRGEARANGTRTDSHVYVAAAMAGATAFGAAVEASEPTGFTYSNPWITVTPMGSPFVTFQRSGTVDLGIVAARSADMGMTWATLVIATDTRLLNDRDLPYPCPSAISGRIFSDLFLERSGGGHERRHRLERDDVRVCRRCSCLGRRIRRYGHREPSVCCGCGGRVRHHVSPPAPRTSASTSRPSTERDLPQGPWARALGVVPHSPQVPSPQNPPLQQSPSLVQAEPNSKQQLPSLQTPAQH